MSFRDTLWALLVVVLWAFNFIVIKTGLDEFPPLLFSCLRFVAAAVPAVLLVGRGGIPWRVILGVGLTLGAGMFSFLTLGMAHGVPPGLASLLMQFQALITPILALAVLGDQPSSWQKAGIGVAVAGIVLIGWELSASASVLGMLLVLGGAASWAMANIQIKQAGNIDAFRLIIWMSLVPPVPLALLSLFFETGQAEALRGLTFTGVAAVLYTGLASTVLAFGIWSRLIRKHSPTVVAPFSLLVPVFGMAFAALLLGEDFGPYRLTAAALVFFGVFLAVLGPRLSPLLQKTRPARPLTTKP
ncbi:EamA family transporter [Desulfocurvibacter africanus]|uniref:EamA domain-containing protein n=1 Tax=Desulfocurvibacter africanus subsp. africanus str. Walvis Bay TaxID=690850 RepID=F3YZX8_DESAF|nr:EamA family transporter [Desulfocurvibacter africanus]EGJ50933.1 protein of unknown function DUF6 transmembrane [Desulfocurvibacter africanus subsp. africanus str. Walvis Bay]